MQVSHEEKKSNNCGFFPEKHHYFLVYSQIMNYNIGSGFKSALDRRHGAAPTETDVGRKGKAVLQAQEEFGYGW